MPTNEQGGNAHPPAYEDIYLNSQNNAGATDPPSFAQSQFDKNFSTFPQENSAQVPQQNPYFPTQPSYYPPQTGFPAPQTGFSAPQTGFSAPQTGFSAPQTGFSPYPGQSPYPTQQAFASPYPTQQPYGGSPYPVYSVHNPNGVPQGVPVMTTFRSNNAGRQIEIICGHCSHHMMFFESGVARCPTCRKISFIDSNNARRRANIYIIVGVLLLLASIGTAVGMFFGGIATCRFGLCAIWLGPFLMGIGFIAYGIRFVTMKKSLPYVQ